MRKDICQMCQYSKWIDKWGDRKIFGCTHASYQGKWIGEINECPKTVGKK